MIFRPIDRMLERIELSKDDSDLSYFTSLMYLGEMLVKIIASGMIAAINDERERHRYRLLHRLVRADGIGEWAACIDQVLIGPASQHLNEESRLDQKDFTTKSSVGSWQYECVTRIQKCLCELNIDCDGVKLTTDLRKWYSSFAVLRNKTRGHGAPSFDSCSKIAADLEVSLMLVVNNLSLFKRQWVYLHRNLSGKYKVTRLTENSSLFDHLKSSGDLNYTNGIYVYFNKPCKTDLIHSDSESSDFFFANGSFNDKRFEYLSYITGNKVEGDSTQYLKPANELPTSETQGLGSLDTQGNIFGNLPSKPIGYIKRDVLENELSSTLLNDRHPVVTLVGRGGIGKTSLALSVLHDISLTSRFTAILWFSARDIDLLPQGPKIVKPHILSVKDIAKEFVRLLDPTDKADKTFDESQYFSQHLSKVPVGPILFVFDNFETVINPSELFVWLDTYIRLPNKILITTRHRDFKGDYPIEVSGMSERECLNLINTTAHSLNISSLLSTDYIRQVTDESEGHPYVIKVLLGEVAKANQLVKIDRIIASKDDILEALFERTYTGLSPAAKRVFLTLCNWRSTVPNLAIEAVMMRPGNEKLDVSAAIDELSKSSFIEMSAIEGDETLFTSVPLAAAVFGSRKLSVDPYKNSIELDLKLLQYFGASQLTDIKHGIKPRIERLFKQLADRISKGIDKLDYHIPMLEFISRKYPPAWLLLGRLYQESNGTNSIEEEKSALRHYLEFKQDEDSAKEVWERILVLSKSSGDIGSEIHALYELCELPCASYKLISDCANRINGIFRDNFAAIDTDEKRHIVDKIVSVMGKRIDEADATDLSRLSWLCLHLKDEQRAFDFAYMGYNLDNNNEYCIKLINKFDKYKSIQQI